MDELIRREWIKFHNLDWSSGQDTCLSSSGSSQVAGVRFPDREHIISLFPSLAIFDNSTLILSILFVFALFF